jgi:hypothetical protein
VCAAILAVLPVIGCASSPSGPSYLSVPHAQYERAFDAACAAARDEGFVPEVVDRNAVGVDRFNFETNRRTSSDFGDH